MGLRQQKKERTRQGFVEAGMRLFAERGFEATTVEQIAGEVGVSTRTFFRYFETKEALLFGYVDGEMEVMEAAIGARPWGESLAQSVVAVVRELGPGLGLRRGHYAFVRQLARESVVVEEYERRVVMPRIEGMMCAAITRRLGATGSDMRPRAWAAVLMALLHEAKLRWLEGPESLGMDAYIEQMLEALPGMFEPMLDPALQP